MPIRILIADDHEIVRRGLKRMFEGTDVCTRPDSPLLFVCIRMNAAGATSRRHPPGNGTLIWNTPTASSPNVFAGALSASTRKMITLHVSLTTP